MYPDEVNCGPGSHAELVSSLSQGVTSRDNIEVGALSLAWYITFAYAMSREVGVDDPDSWFAAAEDPRALEKLMALQHLSGPWAPEVASVVSGCQSNGQLESCLQAGTIPWERARAVASHVELLERGISEGNCYDRLLWETDLDQYLDAIEPLWPNANWTGASAAASAAFNEVSGGEAYAPFQEVAPAVLQAIDQAGALQLRCPGSELLSHYGYSCPP
jgi:hypothetical protein